MKAKIKNNPLWKPKKGGPRPGSGRPRKQDKDEWGQITCVLRKDTIEALRAGAATKSEIPGKHFGDFLQWHLDLHPLPSRAEYQAHRNGRQLNIEIGPRSKPRKMPLLISTGTRRVRAVRVRRPKARLSKKEFAQAILAVE